MNNLVQANPGLPSVQEFQTLKELGQMAIKSGFLPQGIRMPEQAIIVMLKGRELGIPPMQAFSSIAVINGKPTMSAELMLSMIYRNVPGAVVNFVETTNLKCVIEAKRPHGKPTTFSFTIEDAKTANLTGKGPWITYPSAMLRARCISAMARAMYPDALSGVVYTPEELDADVDESGEIIAVPTEEPPSEIKDAELANEAEASGDYVVKGGKYSGKKIKEIEPADLANHVADIEAGLTKKGSKATPNTADLLHHASVWLGVVGGDTPW